MAAIQYHSIGHYVLCFGLFYAIMLTPLMQLSNIRIHKKYWKQW